MGLFRQQPEEPTEWAGLPSEPERSETTAERLADAAPVDPGGLGLGGLGLGGLGLDGLGAGTVESIVLPVVPAVEIIESQESGEGDPPGQ